MRDLKEIALELLDKYEDSEMGCVSEGISTVYDMKELDEECKWYREEIEAAASVVERKKGKWISRKNELKNKDWWTCSECQGRFDYEWKFCPNCGADMREENDNG